MESILIEARVVGQRRPVLADWSIPLPSGEAQWTLRGLIEHVVAEEVAAFRVRREQRGLTRVLTPEQIRDGAAAGRVEMGGREAGGDADPEQAVRTALLAFEDGLYYVFIDDQQVTDLDAVIPARGGSRVTFLRLTALAGG